MGQSTSTLQITAMFLWRGGLALAGAASLYYGAWHYVRQFAWPTTVKVGVTLALVGALFVLLSLVLERRRDALSEGDLRE